jgi:hypothetical protein
LFGIIRLDPAVSDRLHVVFIRFQETDAWGDYRKVMIGGSIMLIPAGPGCKDCVDLKKAWPLIQTMEAFILRYKSDKAFRDLVEAARIVLKDAGGEFDLPSLVQSCRRNGMKVQRGMNVSLVFGVSLTYSSFVVRFDIAHLGSLQTSGCFGFENMSFFPVAILAVTCARVHSPMCICRLGLFRLTIFATTDTSSMCVCLWLYFV